MFPPGTALTATAHAPDHTAHDASDAATVAALERQGADLQQRLDDLPRRILAEVVALKPLMSVKDVAKTLGVSPRTVETLIGDKELRPIWVKGQRRFHPDTVAAYVDACARRSAA